MTFGLGGMFDVAGKQEFGSMPTVVEWFNKLFLYIFVYSPPIST